MLEASTLFNLQNNVSPNLWTDNLHFQNLNLEYCFLNRQARKGRQDSSKIAKSVSWRFANCSIIATKTIQGDHQNTFR